MTSRPAKAAGAAGPLVGPWCESPRLQARPDWSSASPYDLLFGQRKAPDGTSARTGPPAAAGKPPTCTLGCWPAEPHATAERRRELRIEAARQARHSPLFFDLTISLSKSISIFHASLGENARLARQAGDQTKATGTGPPWSPKSTT